MFKNNGSHVITEFAGLYAYWMSGPIRIVLGIIGAIGNIVSIIIFTRPHMTKSDVNFVLIGKY